MKPRDRRLPDIGLFIYKDNKAQRVASFWIQAEKNNTCAKGKAEATFTIQRGEWLNLFAVLKGYELHIKPPNVY